MELPSALLKAIEEEVGDSQIKPEYSLKRKHNELFVAIVWKFDAQGVSNEMRAMERSVPKFSPDKKSDDNVSNVTILSTANASAKKKHKSPCRIRRNKRKLAVLKRKIAERKALAATPPDSTGISSCTVAGPPVAVLDPAIPVPSSVSTCAGIKPSTHVAAENMPSGTEVVKPELLNRKSQRIIEKPKIDIDSLEVTFLKMKSRFSFAPKCCGCQTTDYFKRRWISCDENFPKCKFNDFVCENCFSKSRCATNGRCKMKKLEFIT